MHNIVTNNQFYRPNVGIMLLNANKEIFIGKRTDAIDAWQMPQGGIDEGENIVDAAYRELLEETGISKVKLIAESGAWYRYDIPEEFQKHGWDSYYRGQRQKWILMSFQGNNQDINLQYHHQEFSDWKWMKSSQLLKVVVNFKQQVYQAILEEFSNYLVVD